MKNFFLALSIIMLGMLGGCAKSAQNCADDIADFTPKFEAALTKYVNDPTEANCNAYKAVLLDYLNEIDGCSTPGVSEAQISSLRQSVKDINCK